MKKAFFYFLSLFVFIIGYMASADEVLKATSEDLKEFDRILIQAQAKKNVDQKKSTDVVPEKKKDKQLNPRDNFQNDVTQDGKPLRANRPFDRRPPPGAYSPGDGLRAPPPPPPPPPAPPKEPAQTSPQPGPH